MWNRYSFLNGSWEEKGVFGPRLEISKKHLVFLWRMSPVLETDFTVEKDGEKYRLIPKENGLRYSPAEPPYGTLTSLFWENGKITAEKEYPVTGKDIEVLEKVESTRFRNVKIVDREYFPLLEGNWLDENGYRLTFNHGILSANGKREKIHAVRGNASGEISIVSADPAVTELFGFSRFRLLGDVLEANVLVCDAAPVILHFRKEEK